MTDQNDDANKGGRPRKYPSDVARPTITFRVRGPVHDRLKTDAKQNNLSLSEEVERRIKRSFELDDEINNKDNLIRVLKENLNDIRTLDEIMWPAKDDKVLGQIFSAVLMHTQRAMEGKSWREEPSVQVAVCDAMLSLMREYSRYRYPAFPRIADGERIDRIAKEISTAVAETLGSNMPPLKPLSYEDDPLNWTGQIRSVATFRDKASGQVLETVTISERGLVDRKPSESPEFIAAIEKYRPRRETIELETSVVRVLNNDTSVWNLKPDVAEEKEDSGAK